jgi:hypothetical protein
MQIEQWSRVPDMVCRGLLEADGSATPPCSMLDSAEAGRARNWVFSSRIADSSPSCPESSFLLLPLPKQRCSAPL